MRLADLGRLFLWPAVFSACVAYLCWYFPGVMIRFGWSDASIATQYPSAGDVTLLVIAGAAVSLVFGTLTAGTTGHESSATSVVDRLSLFLGRVCMLAAFLIVAVMFYEVVLRYVFERPTLWANELSLWMAGFIFLLSGLYAMQQRSHIRIYILYDMMPRNVQRACDVVSTVLIVVFAAAVVYGGYGEAYDKLLRWETFGTAFDPPIPATLKPAVLVIVVLVAVQAVSNLICDWSKERIEHNEYEELDADEIERLKQQNRG